MNNYDIFANIPLWKLKLGIILVSLRIIKRFEVGGGKITFIWREKGDHYNDNI